MELRRFDYPVRYLPARVPNQALDITGTIDAWDRHGSFPGDSMLADLRLGSFRNINVEGSPYSATAPTIPHWHPLFESSIEDGIREIVLHLVKVKSWITYTSCEGHNYGSEGPPPAMRHVGILPRSNDEFGQVHRYLQTVVADCQTLNDAGAVSLALILHPLRDSIRSVNVIDFIFAPGKTAGWPAYFSDLDEASRTVLDAMRTGPNRELDSND